METALTAAQRRNLTGPRSIRWTYLLHDLDGVLIGNLDGVQSGEFGASTGAVIRTGGRLSWHRPPSGVTPDWARVLIQPVYRATFPDGTYLEWPFGLFIPAAPKTSQRGAAISADLELYDQLLYLDEDRFDDAYSLPAGAIITDVVREILTDAGRLNVVVADSAETLAAPMTWEGGTSRLRILNDLLGDALGYFSLWVDGYGTFRAEPYVSPMARPSAWTFADNSSSIYTPELDEERDTFNAPNRVYLVARAPDGETLPLTAVAENLNPADPLSIPARNGRRVTVRFTDVDAASQTVLDSIAVRYLDGAGRTGTAVTLDHFPLPPALMDLNARVTYANNVTGTTLTGVVRAWSIRTEGAALMKSTLREVTP